jgi:hypothetical protein
LDEEYKKKMEVKKISLLSGPFYDKIVSHTITLHIISKRDFPKEVINKTSTINSFLHLWTLGWKLVGL